MECKFCGSENTQRVKVAYEQGVTKLTAKTKGPAFAVHSNGGVSMGVGGYKTETTEESTFAKKLAPPKTMTVIEAITPPFALWLLLQTVLPYVFGLKSFTVIAAINITLLVYLLFRLYQYIRHNFVERPKLMLEWEASWVCHRCGAVSNG